MNTFKKMSTFVAVVMAVTTFTSCENRLDAPDVTDHNISIGVKSHHADFYNAMYHSGEYDYQFNEFSLALSILMRDDDYFRAMVLQEFEERGRNILLKHLVEREGDYLWSVLSPYVDVDFFLEHFQNMRIGFRGNIDRLAWQYATGNIESVLIAYKPSSYKLGQDDVLSGYVNGETFFQFVQHYDGDLIVLELTTNPYVYDGAVVEELTSAVKEFAEEWDIAVNFEIVEVFSGIDEIYYPGFSRISTRNSEFNTDWDIDNSVTMRLRTLENNFTVITTPRKNNPNIMSYVMLSTTGVAVGFIADVNFNSNNGTVEIVLFDEFDPIDIGEEFRSRGGGCGWKGFVALGGTIAMIASAPITWGLGPAMSAGFLVYAYADWFACMMEKLPYEIPYHDGFLIMN